MQVLASTSEPSRSFSARFRFPQTPYNIPLKHFKAIPVPNLCCCFHFVSMSSASSRRPKTIASAWRLRAAEQPATQTPCGKRDRHWQKPKTLVRKHLIQAHHKHLENLFADPSPPDPALKPFTLYAKAPHCITVIPHHVTRMHITRVLMAQ